MNVIALIVLVALVTNYLVSTVVSVANVRAMRPDVPDEFSDTFEHDTYRKSQDYTRAKTRLGLVVDTFELFVLLAFWFAGGFEFLDQAVRSLGWGATGTGVAFVVALLAAQSLIGLPFSIYATFVLEERFGFNRTTVMTFVVDRLKGIILSALIGIPVIATILWFFNTIGALAWLYSWLIVVGFSLVMQYIAPTLIMPLFNKFEPLEEGELRRKIVEMADRAGFPIKNILVMDGSKRSSKSNAFFTGFGSKKRIALYDTLVDQHTEDELVAVLAHEIGHYKKKHILQGLVVSIIHTGLLFYVLSLLIDYPPLFEAFYVTEPSTYAGLVFFGLLLSPLDLILGPTMNALSRRNEFQADRFAAELTGAPKDLISALKGLSKTNLTNLTPHQAYVTLHYSHPPVLQRIQVLQNL